jgi:hypothetical protein
MERIAASHGLAHRDAAGRRRLLDDFRSRLGSPAPADVVRYAAAPGLAQVLARSCDAQVVFPDALHVAPLDLGPGLRGDELWLMAENQGVCVWAVPLDAGDHPPVLVAGDLPTDAGPQVYAGSLDEFAAAWDWDLGCVTGRPLLQAQAVLLTPETEIYLRKHLRPAITTWGWPTRRVQRLGASDGLRILLWDGPAQCDWFVSAPEPAVLGRWLHRLMTVDGLADALWSNDDIGERILADARSAR